MTILTEMFFNNLIFQKNPKKNFFKDPDICSWSFIRKIIHLQSLLSTFCIQYVDIWEKIKKKGK